MFLMLFVNDLNDPDLGHVTGVPEWLNHMPAHLDGLTFVDVIFPAFLFSVGLSIPLALVRRLAVEGDTGRVCRHIVARSLALMFIGLGMVNTYRFHPTAMPISPGLWELLFFLAVILVWNRSGHPDDVRSPRPGIPRLLGIVTLVGLIFIYRGSDGVEATWMRTSWWGILTAIGIAYFISAITYVGLRRQPLALAGVFGLLTALNIGDRTGVLAAFDPLRPYFPVGGMLGGLPSITLAGVLAGMALVSKNSIKSASMRIRGLLGFALTLTLIALLLRLPFGISKHALTPAWCLLSTAICCVIFAFFHWLVDTKGIRAWAAFVRPVGRQPLLAYFLPHVFYSLLAVAGIPLLEHHFNAGWLGILRSLLLALGFVGLTQLLTHLHVNLKP